MSENRRQILEMLASGRINANEAERLLNAVESTPAPGFAGHDASAKPRAKAKYIRVLVEDDNGPLGRGPGTVNVRVPLQLLRAGVRLASLIPPQAHEHLNHAMQQHGLPINLAQIKPENLEEIVDLLEELTVDVDQKDGRSKVRVFCE